ncbi:YIP1 family protein [Candidatus Desantisbacteria bacterium]|nr:YIP1 family protein [Candidatus Desantisbacteria bacterium]
MNPIESYEPQEEMGMQGLEIIYQLFTNPILCMQRLPNTAAGFYVALIIILSGISIAVSEFILLGANSPSIIKSFFPLWLVLSVTGIAGIWFISGAIFHLVAEWLNGQGKASVLLIALGLSLAPNILTIPAILVSQACGELSVFIYFFFKLLILVWVFKIQVIAIREVHRISTFKALLVFGSPSMIIAGILIVLMVMIGVTLGMVG